MKTNNYTLGTRVEIYGVFQTRDEVDIDPDIVTAKYKKPDGTIITKLYGTDSEIVKESQGNYYMNVDTDADGVWYYRWIADGAEIAGADEDHFIINRSEF